MGVNAAEVVFFETIDKAITCFENKEWRACLAAVARGRAQYGTDGGSMDARTEMAFARMGEMEAECLSSTGRHEDAIMRAEENISMYPTRIEGPYILGRVLHRAGRLGEAKDALGKAYIMNPKAAQVRVAMQAIETDIRLQKSKAVAVGERPSWERSNTTASSHGSTPRGPPQGVPPLRINKAGGGGGGSPRMSYQTPREWLLQRAEMQKAATVSELAGELAAGLLEELKREEMQQAAAITPLQRWRAPVGMVSIFILCCAIHMSLESDGTEMKMWGVPLTLFTTAIISIAMSIGVLDLFQGGVPPWAQKTFGVSKVRSTPASKLISDATGVTDRVNEGVAKTAKVLTTPRQFDTYTTRTTPHL